MHLVECWETRGKMEEDERETGKMISGVPPPLARSSGPSVCRKDGARKGMQCNVMEEQCNRWRSAGGRRRRRPEILSHRFASSDWREDREQG